MLQKRQEYVEKTKNALVFNDMPSEKPVGKKGRRKGEEYISGSEGSDMDAGPSADGEVRDKKRKKKESRDSKKKGKPKRGRDDTGGNDHCFLPISTIMCI